MRISPQKDEELFEKDEEKKIKVEELLKTT